MALRQGGPGYHIPTLSEIAEGLKADVYKVELKFLKNYNGNKKHETCWNMHWMRCQSIARLPPSISSGFLDELPVPIYTPVLREAWGE